MNKGTQRNNTRDDNQRTKQEGLTKYRTKANRETAREHSGVSNTNSKKVGDSNKGRSPSDTLAYTNKDLSTKSTERISHRVNHRSISSNNIH